MSQGVEYVIYGVPAASGVTDWLPTVASAISAIVSVCVAFWAAKITKKQTSLLETHNKLSVTPHLDGGSHKNDTDKTFEYRITNNGIGPAIIREAYIFVDGILMESDDPVVEAIEKLRPGISYDHYGHESVELNSFLPAGCSVTLMTFVGRKSGHSADELYKLVAGRAYITAVYDSIYGDRYEFDSRKSR